MATQIGDDEVLEQRYPANAQDPMELMALLPSARES